MIPRELCILMGILAVCSATARNDIFVGYSEKVSTTADKGDHSYALHSTLKYTLSSRYMQSFQAMRFPPCNQAVLHATAGDFVVLDTQKGQVRCASSMLCS